jgi:hypothetical protein
MMWKKKKKKKKKEKKKGGKRFRNIAMTRIFLEQSQSSHLSRVNSQDSDSRFWVWRWEFNLSIDTTGSKESGIENICAGGKRGR